MLRQFMLPMWICQLDLLGVTGRLAHRCHVKHTRMRSSASWTAPRQEWLLWQITVPGTQSAGMDSAGYGQCLAAMQEGE